MRRATWLVAGAALGAGGTLWAQIRLRRLVGQLAPDQVVDRAQRALVGTGDRVRLAVAAGRDAAVRHEADLWAALDSGMAGDSPAPAGTGERPPAAGTGRDAEAGPPAHRRGGLRGGHRARR